MESLSIKKTGKVLLAVALVIFMLVALLGLSIYGHTVAAASAEDPDLEITAVFTASSATAHSDSTDTAKYYNQLASGTGAKPLAVNDTFTVTYSFDVNSDVFTGATYLDLTNDGFAIVSVTVNSVNLTTGSGTTTTSNGIYTMSGDKKSKIGFDGNGGFMTAVDDIVVVYKLTEAIATYSNKTIGLSGYVSTLDNANQEISSTTVAVYVRSTASIANADPAKTYDSTAAANAPTFTPAVSDTGNESRRETPVVTWSADGSSYSATAPINAGTYYTKSITTANDYYEATEDVDTFTIEQKAVTLTAENKTTEHGDALATLTWTGDSGFYSADGVTVSASTTAATTGENSNVGTYPITLATSATPTSGYAGLANYDITYQHAQTSGDYGVYTITRKFVAVPTVTVVNGGETAATIAVGTSEDVNYNGAIYSFDYAAASDNAYSGVASPAASKNVGTYVLTLTVGSNYRWGATVEAAEDLTDKVFTYVVKKVDLHVSLNHDAITYRDAAPTSGYSISLPTAAVGGETVDGISLTQANFGTAYTQGNPVGTYAITLTEDSATDTAIKTAFSNYNVIYDTANKLSVGKLTVTADNTWIAYTDSASVTYDAAAHGIVAVPAKYTMTHSDTSAVICNVALSGGDNSNGTQTHVSGDEAAVTLTATFTLKGDSAVDDYSNVITANYTLAEGVQTKNITITRKAITVTANPKTITYGDAFANDGVTYGTFAGSETSAVLTGTLAYATDYVAEAENAKRVVGTYYIRPSGLSNNDYAISFVDGVLTVSKKTVTITWSTPNTWIYDGSAHIVTATIGDTEYSEEITAAAYNTDTALTNVGSSSRSVTSLSDDDNYAIPENSQAFSVTARTVTVAVTPASNFTYDSASHTIFTVAVSNLVGNESLTFAYTETGHDASGSSAVYKNGSYTFAAEWADDYTLVFTGISAGVAGDSQTAGAASNYTLSADEEKSMSIAKYTFTWAAATYSGNVATWTAPTTIQTGDSITFAYSLKLAGTEKLASDTALTYTATETGVYTLSVTFTGTEAANYNTIDAQTLNTVFSVTLADTSYNNATYGHPHNGEQIASVTQYAFDGQTVPGVSDWAVAGYDFKGWYVDATDRTSAKFSASNAVTATVTYVASWDVVTYNVTYKYKLAGADSWETWKSNVVTTYYTALQTVPSNKWFSNVGWNDAEAMNGSTKTILDYTSDRTYYTVYTFKIKNGDVDGSGSVTDADATLYRQYNVGGYAVNSNVKTTIAEAWAVTDVLTEYAFAVPADNTYFLIPVSDVDGDGAKSTNDIFYIINSQVDNSDYATAEDGAVVIKIRSTNVTDNTAFAGIPATPTTVTVAGAAAAYDYASKTVTLNAALTSGQKLEIVVNGVKYVYT